MAQFPPCGVHFVTAQQAIDYRCHCEEGGAVSAAGVTDCHSPSGFAMTVVVESLCADFERVVVDGASALSDPALHFPPCGVPYAGRTLAAVKFAHRGQIFPTGRRGRRPLRCAILYVGAIQESPADFRIPYAERKLATSRASPKDVI